MTEALNPLQLPLHGSRLIEASAGTGKTWTIAALYLRLVLGHGAEGEAFTRPLLPREILVMTFTRAATRELSDRIRQRLLQAAACFRGEAAPEAGDDFLAALLQHCAEGPAREAAAWRLASSAQAMDEAAVLTIDAWCQRMLREHAFDSGSLLDEELLADPSQLRSRAVADYWREQVYPLEDDALALVLQRWASPQQLELELKTVLEQVPPGGQGPSLADLIGPALQQRRQQLAALKRGWAERAAQMREWLDATTQARPSPFNGSKLRPDHYQAWLSALAAWADDALAMQPALSEAARRRLTPAGLAEARRAGAAVEPPGVFAEFEALMEALSRLPEPGRELRAHAAAGVGARLAELKRQAGTLGFLDLQQRLHDALDEARHGESVRRLRQRILAQFPAALVDEFQDTSPLQLAIFDRLYGLQADAPGTLLLLIGDPKQSIYGFRGADIYSYLRARRATAGRHHRLERNHRSTVALVDAVNRLFARAQQRPGAGAFLFRGEPRAAGEELPYEPVAARGREERLVCAAGEVPALTWALDPELRGTTDSRERLAQACAGRIAALLADARAGFEQPGREFRRLRPADVAVLVRHGKEAQAVRRALQARGVASVYLSDRDSVLASDEARDLVLLLQAVASPREARRLRAALATALLGLSLDELRLLADDEARFDSHGERFQALQDTWRARGVLAMLRQALHTFELPGRWLAGEGGERRLTNVLHLAELLQAAAATLEGEQALIRWLIGRIQDTEAGLGAQDEQLLRLESDADRVQVITVHKSKGLEYPLVCLPFATHFRAAEPARGSGGVFLPDAGGTRRWVAEPSGSEWRDAEQERLREDLRLLYVALTRARHALWVGVAPLKIGASRACTWHRSALGCLVSGAEPRTAEEVAEALRAWHDPAASVVLEGLDLPGDSLPAAPQARPHPPAQEPPLPQAPPYLARFDRQWGLHSYSALVRDASRAVPSAALAAVAGLLRDDEPAEGASTAQALPSTPAQDAPWHRFPRGAWAGNVLHELLEWLASEGFALPGSEALCQALRRRCTRIGWGHRAEELLPWLQRLCATPLPPLGTSLGGLRATRPELEFWLPSQTLQAEALDALCREHFWPGQPRPPLPARTLRGMLMGFADLVFEHDGRFWVLDYKSNALGPGDADYTPEAMCAAMRQHRYDVQAALYLLALHRLLRARLRDAYDPSRQLGGAVYLFLRGVAAPGAGCLHLAPPLALLDALDAMAGAMATEGPR